MLSLPRVTRFVPLLALAMMLAIAPSGASAQVDLNSASYGELVAIDGISQSMAQRIIEARPLRTKRDLVTRLGMQESVYSRVSDYVVARQGTGSGTSGSGTGTGSGTGRTSGTGTGGDFGRGTGTGNPDFGTGTGTGGRTNTGTGGGQTNTGTGSGNMGTGTGSGTGTGTGPSTSGTGDGNVYRENYRTGRSSLRTGSYQDSIDRLLEAQRLAEQYGNRQEVAEIEADLASAYLWRGIELYKDATWAQDYDNAIAYLRRAEIRITNDDLWMNALGGASVAMRKLNLKNYYLGMCYFEKGAYFDWVDNDGFAKMHLSMVTKSREQWNYFTDPKVLMEQKILYADAKYTLAQLLEKSRDTEYAAQNYMEAYKTYGELKATGVGELFYYWGEGERGTSYNQLYFSTRRKKRQTMDEKMQSMESSLISLANQSTQRANYGQAREYANFVFKNSRQHDTRSQALDATIASYEKANDFNRAIDLRRQYRNDFGYHKHTLGMANNFRAIGDNTQAKGLYQEVIKASGADRQYQVAAADGLAEISLPEIDGKISAGNLDAAVASIRSFLDSYPTSRKDDFTRRIGDVVDKYVASGNTAEAIKLIDEFTSRYSSGNNALLDSKKVSIIEKSGDVDAFRKAVLDFDSKYSRSAPGLANEMLVRLVQALEKSGGNDSAVQELIDRLASRGNSFGTGRHQQAAQAELSRIKGLGNKAQIRAGLLKMAVFPDSRYATAKAVIDSARELYLAQYASPWYYEAKQRAANSPASARGTFGGVKDEKAQLKHDLNTPIWTKVQERELSTYARWDAVALDRHFGPQTDAMSAWSAVKDRIEKELTAHAAWQDAGMFRKGGPKKAYEALRDSRPTRADLENTFFSKAYAAGGGTGTGNGNVPARREGAPSFDGANR